MSFVKIEWNLFTNIRDNLKSNQTTSSFLKNVFTFYPFVLCVLISISCFNKIFSRKLVYGINCLFLKIGIQTALGEWVRTLVGCHCTCCLILESHVMLFLYIKNGSCQWLALSHWCALRTWYAYGRLCFVEL